MKRLTPSIVAAIVTAALTGCSPKTVDTFCTSYTPTTYDAELDTPATKQQIRENNAVWLKLCKKF